MNKAFDTMLQATVSATAAAANSDNEAFRYECLCCGEEVYLAAQDSVYKATHFRHRSGNNDKECELYLGQYGIIPTSLSGRSKKQDRVEFYYKNLHKAFFMAFRFNEAEISTYEKIDAYLEVSTSHSREPFFTQEIDHMRFFDDVPEMFMLEQYSDSYYISNSSNDIKREYRLFSAVGPTFFKVQGEDNDFTAKYIKSKSLYTNVKYFIAWPGRNAAQIFLRETPGVQVDSVSQFKTMNNCNVWAMVATFTEKNTRLDSLLQSWGYNLSTAEELTLLWPPAYESNEDLHVFSNSVFIFSSFALQASGNTNATAKAIHEVDPSVTRIDLKDKLKILKKNAEMSVEASAFSQEAVFFCVKFISTAKFVVPTNGVFYRFSSYGVEKLSPGQTVFLTSKTTIVEYDGNYTATIITMPSNEKLPLSDRINDALHHYWVLTPYEHEKAPEGNLSPDTLNYLRESKNKGLINMAVLGLIQEDKNE